VPIPTLITELSQTAASNYPQGSDSPATLDDTQRAHGGFIATLRDGKGFSNPVTIASATTTDIGGQNSQFVEISGTNTITGLGSTYNGPRYLRFTGALVLTHNATTLNLPGAASITTGSGDSCIAVPNIELNGWNVLAFNRAAGGGGVDYLNSTRIDVASATTLNLTTSAPNTRNINITGTTAITGVTVAIGQLYFVRFNAALTLTNNASIVTQTGANITTAAGDTCILRATAANTIELLSYVSNGVIPQSKGGTGYAIATRQLAQVQTFQTGAVATGTTILPYDDTIPQNTEGDQYISLAITPTNTASTLEIIVELSLSSSASVGISTALFQDAAVGALSAIQHSSNTSQIYPVVLIHYMVAGTTSATTFKVRSGPDVGATITFNGISGARRMGSLMASRITVREYLP
jgi:hypothetical protein